MCNDSEENMDEVEKKQSSTGSRQVREPTKKTRCKMENVLPSKGQVYVTVFPKDS